MPYRTVRGAVTAENTKESILQNSEDMLNKILESNNINIDNIISVLFTCTSDLTAVYPAVAARKLGITGAGLFCMQEMYVEGSLQKCIRVLITFETESKQKDIKHVYLKEAAALRLDLK